MEEPIKSRMTVGSLAMTIFLAMLIIQSIFVILKVAGLLSWSWVWTLSPLIAICAAIVTFFVFLVVYAFIMFLEPLFQIRKKNKQKKNNE